MKSFSVPIFGARVYFTRDHDEAQHWQDKRRFDTSIGAVDGFCSSDNGEILVYIKNDDFPLLAHECLHAAYRILEYTSIESRDEELLAYLMEFVMTECLKFK